MKHAIAAVLSLAFLVGTAAAQDAPPAGALNDNDLKALVANKKLTFQDAAGGTAGSGGIAEYRANGAYVYSFGPNAYRGKWTVEGGRLCATTGRDKRCDWLTKEGETYFMVTGARRAKYRFTMENL